MNLSGLYNECFENELEKVAEVDEESYEKVASDYFSAGRFMARGFHDEMQKIAKKEPDTYPISRALTSPELTAAIMAIAGTAGASHLGASRGSAIAQGLGSGGIHYALRNLTRRIGARALKGRLVKNEGLIGKEKEFKLK